MNTPDLRVFFNNYRVADGDTTYSINQSFYPSPTRYFRVLNENRTDIKMHVEQPLDVEWAEDAKFSAGASFVRTTRAHEENSLGLKAPTKICSTPWRRLERLLL